MKNPKLWKNLVLLTLVFIAGGVAGGVATHFYIQRVLAEAFDFDRLPDHAMKVLTDRLSLQPEQEPKVRAHVTAMAAKLKVHFRTAVTAAGQLVVASGRLVDQELTPEQKVVHAEMKREFREGMQKGMNITLPEE